MWVDSRILCFSRRTYRMDISEAERKMSALAVRSSGQWGRHFYTIKAAETNNEEKESGGRQR